MKARMALIFTLLISGMGVRALAAEALTNRTPNGVKIECVYEEQSESYFVIFSKWHDLEVVPYQLDCPKGK
jgi:hypothetical protein